MRPLFQAVLPKVATAPGEVEDSLALRPARGLFAVSDGASESYDSAEWARILTRRFVARPSLGADWVGEAITEYAAQYNRDSMGWSAQAAFDRGSFATLLGLSLGPGERVAHLLAVGDSLAVLADAGGLRASFPYQRPEQFTARPMLLSTMAERNVRLLDPEAGHIARVEWDMAGLVRPRLLLMTDAVGAWLLADPELRLARLLGLESPAAFADLVEAEREAATMRRDDCTLLVLG
jgi:hypothetical protein